MNADKLKQRFLKEHIYKGLTNLNSGWDAPSIYYFNESDFKIVLDRVEKLGLGIFGIEPWDDDNHYYDVKTFGDYTDNPADANWYRKVFNEYKAEGIKLQYAASYFVPKELLLKTA